jgi:hypothetical protein
MNPVVAAHLEPERLIIYEVLVWWMRLSRRSAVGRFLKRFLWIQLNKQI